MKKGILSFVGFFLFIVGMLSLALSFVGVRLSFLLWLEKFGGGVGLLLKLVMVVLGAIIVYVSRSDFAGRGG